MSGDRHRQAGEVVLRAVHFERRLPSSSRPFEGRAVDAAGHEYHLCVKPQIREKRELCASLLAEWCGYTLARQIGLPVPRHFLVEISQGFIDSTAGALGDVAPGLAFGSEWQENSFPAIGLTPADVSNPESMAGACVLDTLQFNWDRHSDNILEVAPSPGSGGRSRLCYIDHIGPPDFDNYDKRLPTRAQIPREENLRRMVRNDEDFQPFLFSAEALDLRRLAAELLRSPYPEWQITKRGVLRRAVVVGRRCAGVRGAVARASDQFPWLITDEGASNG